jgi:hypothetical protein
VETDTPVPPGILSQIEALAPIYRVMRVPSLEGLEKEGL